MTSWTEDQRLDALRAYDILDTPNEASFDDIVRLAAEICGAPISLISLVERDRQWFKAKTGIDAQQTPIEQSICAHAMLERGVFVVPDTTKDPRFACNTLVTGEPNLRFYAGAALETADHIPLGMLCVLDTVPRQLTHQQKLMLQALARQVMTQIELRRALKDREQSERRLKLAFQASDFAGFWNYDVKKDHLVTDERFATLYGVDPALATRGAPLAAFVSTIHPDDIAHVQAAIAHSLKTGERYRAEYRIRREDGSIVWLVGRGRVSMDDAGQPMHFDGVSVDITERKQREVALHQSEAQFRQLADSIPQLAWMADDQGRIFWFNRRWFDYTGMERGPDGIWDYSTSSDAVELRQMLDMWQSALASGKPFQEVYPLRRSDGAVRWHLTLALPIKDQAGKIVRWFGTNTDVEDQRLLDSALKESEAFTKSIVDSSTDVIKVLDLDGNLLSMNPAGSSLTDIDDIEEVLHQPWADFWTGPDQDAARQAIDLARQGQNGRFVGFFPTMKGTPKWWDVITSPIFGVDGKPVRILCVSRDVTERKKLETETREARELAERANNAKTEFLATMSHEIRTPMNAVVGLSNILAMSQPLSERQREFIKTLQMSADALLSLINDLLDIAKIEARTIELERIPFRMTALAADVDAMMAIRVREKGLAFSSDIEEVRHQTFLGDPTRIRQILINLCSNAVKFTDRGHVRLSVNAHPPNSAGHQTVVIRVADTGIGVAADKLDTIFHKFVQGDQSISRRFGGTGLGLAITKTLAEVMGGSIRVESKVGEGSLFEVVLPLALAMSGHEKADPSPTLDEVFMAITGERPRVLLVEDYEPNVLVASTFLEEFGYAVDVASNGFEAFDKVKAHSYAVVLMDVQMQGMDGFEATGKIRAFEYELNRPRVPIIGMTAHALSGDREKCLAAGMDDYISKPFRPDLLEQMIAELIAGVPAGERLGYLPHSRKAG